MTSILDHFAPKRSGFVPTTSQELFALCLARKLGDIRAATHYAELVTEYSEAQMLVAYRRTIRESAVDLGRRFHEELERVHPVPHHDCPPVLMAVRVERRTVAAAVLSGTHLDYADARQLSSMREKAIASAVGFINWMLARFPAESAILETVQQDHEQREVLQRAICGELRERILPIWEMPKATLLESCAHPQLRSREEVRSIATSIWPVLAGSHAKVFIQDAAILGLYAQIERQFIIN